MWDNFGHFLIRDSFAHFILCWHKNSDQNFAYMIIYRGNAEKMVLVKGILVARSWDEKFHLRCVFTHQCVFKFSSNFFDFECQFFLLYFTLESSIIFIRKLFSLGNYVWSTITHSNFFSLENWMILKLHCQQHIIQSHKKSDRLLLFWSSHSSHTKNHHIIDVNILNSLHYIAHKQSSQHDATRNMENYD